MACEFKESNLTLKATLDMLLFNKILNLKLSFSLNFKGLMKGFMMMAMDLFSSLLQLFGDTVKCIDRMERQFNEVRAVQAVTSV